MTLFHYLCPIDYALDPQDPLSQAVPCVIAEEVNREVQKAEARPTETGPVPVVQRSRACPIYTILATWYKMNSYAMFWNLISARF